MDRDADGASLLGDVTANRLADPPGGVGAELEATGGVKLGDCPQQAQVALLDQVQEGNAAPQVALGNTDDQAQVGADQGCVGFFGTMFDAVQFRFQFALGRQVFLEKF